MCFIRLATTQECGTQILWDLGRAMTNACKSCSSEVGYLSGSSHLPDAVRLKPHIPELPPATLTVSLGPVRTGTEG